MSRNTPHNNNRCLMRPANNTVWVVWTEAWPKTAITVLNYKRKKIRCWSVCLFVWEIFKVLQCLTNNSIQHVLISLTVLLKVVSGVVGVGVSYLLLLFIVLLTHGCLTENVYKINLPGTWLPFYTAVSEVYLIQYCHAVAMERKGVKNHVIWAEASDYTCKTKQHKTSHKILKFAKRV